VVPFGNAYPIPAALSYEDAILVETLSTVVAGLARLNPQPGRRALIIGAGTVGLLWNQLLRRSLSIVVIQSEPVSTRLERAAQLGADRVVEPQKEALDSAVHELCPDGVDYIVDASGCTAAIAEALPLLKRGGTLMSFGICPKEERLPLSLNWFYRRQVSFLTSRRPPREMSRAIHLLEKGLVDSKVVVTGRYALEQIERTFELFVSGKDREIKMAIDPWQKEQQL
jgi:threonine dehydrogenase-like Zn-dependent dehydrogenase